MSILVGLLVIVGGCFIVQLAYEGWHGYHQSHRGYSLGVIPTYSIFALVIFFIATLILTPETFYRRPTIRLMGFISGSFSIIASRIIFPVDTQHPDRLYVALSILALCSTAILFTKAFRAGGHSQHSSDNA